MQSRYRPSRGNWVCSSTLPHPGRISVVVVRNTSTWTASEIDNFSTTESLTASSAFFGTPHRPPHDSERKSSRGPSRPHPGDRLASRLFAPHRPARLRSDESVGGGPGCRTFHCGPRAAHPTELHCSTTENTRCLRIQTLLHPSRLADGSLLPLLLSLLAALRKLPALSPCVQLQSRDPSQSAPQTPDHVGRAADSSL